MKRVILIAALCYGMAILFAGCSSKTSPDNGSGAPPPADVIHEQDSGLFKVEHPEQFPLVKVGERRAAPELTVTGVVNADVARSVPAISLASGRAVDVRARLGDSVKKGQLLLRVYSADISGAYSDYRNAASAEELAKKQLERARLLFDKGAIAKKDLEVAEQAEEVTLVNLQATIEKLKVLGVNDLTHRPEGIVDVYAPVSGVITEQNVSQGGGVKTLDNSPNLFTIANLDYVWVLCDVYENDLPFVRLGEYADVRVAAYPDRVLRGRIGNIGPILDPATRAAKVRLEMKNPRFMSIGMFVTATFYGQEQERRAIVPAAAILHLHDRDWVYVPERGNQFRRVEVTCRKVLSGSMQEVTGIDPGREVVANALMLEATTEE